MNVKKAGIIIVNYKDYARNFLAECRDSLRSQSYPRELTKVYIVDNASTPETCQFIKNSYPEAMIIERQDGNYAAANNAGIKKALEDGCELFVIANMDVKFNKDWLSELVKAVEHKPLTGIAQSKILLYPKKATEAPMINSLGNISHFLGFGFTSNYNQPDRKIIGYPEINGYASGCSFIIKKEVIEKIGGYIKEFYMYHDDMEMSLKARLVGYKIALAPKSVVFHKYEFKRSVRMLYYMERNRYLVLFVFFRLATLILILPAIIAMDLGMMLYSIPGGWFKTKLSVYKYFIKPKHWRAIFRERKKIKSLRKLRDNELLKDFQGRVLFQEIENPILKYIANPVFNFYWKIVKKIIIW